MKSKTEKRASPISYRPPKGLEQEFQLHVERSGLTTSGFITSLWHTNELPRKVRTAPIEKKVLAKMLGKLAIVADEIRYYRQVNANERDIRQILEDIRQLLIEQRTIIIRAMGRRS